MPGTPKIQSEAGILAALDALGIAYQRTAHAPVYTCAQANLVSPDLPGISSKNLLLKDGAGHFFLVLTACEKRLNLKALARAVGAQGRLGFASEAELLALLGLTPGAVTLLALLNDREQRVQLVIDAELWQGEHFLCHPLVNTATLVLSKAGLQTLLAAAGHTPQVLALP